MVVDGLGRGDDAGLRVDRRLLGIGCHTAARRSIEPHPLDVLDLEQAQRRHPHLGPHPQRAGIRYDGGRATRRAPARGWSRAITSAGVRSAGIRSPSTATSTSALSRRSTRASWARQPQPAVHDPVENPLVEIAVDELAVAAGGNVGDVASGLDQPHRELEQQRNAVRRPAESPPALPGRRLPGCSARPGRASAGSPVNGIGRAGRPPSRRFGTGARPLTITGVAGAPASTRPSTVHSSSWRCACCATSNPSRTSRAGAPRRAAPSASAPGLPGRLVDRRQRHPAALNGQLPAERLQHRDGVLRREVGTVEVRARG